ncbi:hypothetical protein ALO65_102244 [Pseudomonas syringae pv. papulans]|nr:hypothetical protein ALO65_102244 [Pseudomonas syringae pv. papulans]
MWAEANVNLSTTLLDRRLCCVLATIVRRSAWHAVLDAPRPVLDARPAERRTLNDPLFPQPLVQCVAADAQAFGQL